ncbi:GIY-YIG nuclease family protein [Flavobacterium oreochromis]|uniref:GIY-YIG nuclease family protein n=1 Tax=Flavobacterium oreochromis TaxID=2906078 RepID=UPI001CE6907B|nr:GIY-YIG nuclease family protein [Flavobacterium oreochromis]QYS85951.1 GIY-YIG nuclease family protein [Flavobacterium oreochromis]
MDPFNPQRGFHSYYVYILTNDYRSTFYIGMTNNLKLRIEQHKLSIQNENKTFVAKYNLKHLVYYQKFTWVEEAIAREKELKKWSRDKKLNLIKEFNPNFNFLNHHFE